MDAKRILMLHRRAVSAGTQLSHKNDLRKLLDTATEQLCETLSLGPRPLGFAPLNTRLLGSGWLPLAWPFLLPALRREPQVKKGPCGWR